MVPKAEDEPMQMEVRKVLKKIVVDLQIRKGRFLKKWKASQKARQKRLDEERDFWISVLLM